MARVKIAHLPMTKRRRATADRQLKNQAAYRERLADKDAPERKDFARVALIYALSIYEADPGCELAVAIHRAIVEPLVAMGFDRTQVNIRFDKMAERTPEDRKRLRHQSEWDRRQRAGGPVED